MKFFFGLCLILVFNIASAVNGQFFEDEHTVIDVRNNIVWLRCTVGQVWDKEQRTCTGDVVKLNHSEIEIALAQASSQLGREWRLPTLLELESLICANCDPPKINKKYFPNVTAEAYWTGKKNFLNSKMYWSVNFMTGHNYSRFFAYQKLPVLFVSDR